MKSTSTSSNLLITEYWNFTVNENMMVLDDKTEGCSPDFRNHPPSSVYLFSCEAEHCVCKNIKPFTIGQFTKLQIINWKLNKYRIKQLQYLRGDAILFLTSETARPTYLSPTSKPSKRLFFISFDFSNSRNKFNGFKYFICTFLYLSSASIFKSLYWITSINYMMNNLDVHNKYLTESTCNILNKAFWQTNELHWKHLPTKTHKYILYIYTNLPINREPTFRSKISIKHESITIKFCFEIWICSV